MENHEEVVLSNGRLRLHFSEGGALLGLTDEDSRRNYISESIDSRLPLFRLTCTESDEGVVQPGEIKISSLLANSVRLEKEEEKLTFFYEGIDGKDLSAKCTVTLPKDSSLSYWRIEIINHTEYAIKSVEYPVIAASAQLGDSAEDDRILLPKLDGYLLPSPLVMEWEGDEPDRTYNQRYLYPGDGRENPNGASVQLVAYYDSEGGMYLAAHDGSGCIKEFGPVWVHEENETGYLDFSPVHHMPEVAGTDFICDYDIVLGYFKGDWQDAALIYKSWAVKQDWCAKKTVQREDIPAWIKKGAFFFNFRLRFQENGEEFLKEVADYIVSWRNKLNIPMVAMMCGWEKLGEWTGPDYFPPYGGESRFRNMCRSLHENGIYAFPFGLSGMKLPIRKKIGRDFAEPHLEIDYDNRRYFKEHYLRHACTGPGGALITDSEVESWDGLHAYACVTTEQARKQLYGATMTLLDDYDIDISQADQVLNGASVECYNGAHDHPPGRGKWQINALRNIYRDIRRDAKAKKKDFVLSEEWLSEPFIQYLDIYHGRNYDEPRGLEGVPLFSFLYHEYIPCYGGDWTSFLPENTSGVYFHGHNFVFGNLPAGCPLTMRYMTRNSKPEEADPRIMEMAENACRVFQKFPQYLIMGEMLPGIDLSVPKITVDFFGMKFSGWNKRKMEKPAVLHCVWKDPEGNIACAFANISDEVQEIKPELSKYMKGKDSLRVTVNDDPPRMICAGETIRLNPRSAAIAEI